jgi:hypothetical protein
MFPKQLFVRIAYTLLIVLLQSLEAHTLRASRICCICKLEDYVPI